MPFSGLCIGQLNSINTHNLLNSLMDTSLKRCLLLSVMLGVLSFSSANAAQPSLDPEFASDVVDRYANHIYYGSGATGMAMVVIDGNQRVFRSFGETRPGSN